MAVQAKSSFQQRPKAKTPAERSVEFDAVQARLRTEAAERRAANGGSPSGKPRRKTAQ
jgi:hypothetical protein